MPLKPHVTAAEAEQFEAIMRTAGVGGVRQDLEYAAILINSRTDTPVTVDDLLELPYTPEDHEQLDRLMAPFGATIARLSRTRLESMAHLFTRRQADAVVVEQTRLIEVVRSSQRSIGSSETPTN